MTAIQEKMEELEHELKNAGLWQKQMPSWVAGYEDGQTLTNKDFAQWLQFVFVPNHLQKNLPVTAAHKQLIVPQAIRHFAEDVNKGKLLQVLIEIDSLL